MALKKANKEASSETTAAGKFESPEETSAGNEAVVHETAKPVREAEVIEGESTVDTTVAESNDEVASPEPEVQAEPAAKPVAEVKKGALSAVKSGGAYEGPAYASLEKVFDPEVIDWNTFVRLKASLEGIVDQDEDLIGKQIVIQLMSWNFRWVVATGDRGHDDLVRFSSNGDTLEGTGQPIKDYVASLVADGFDKASAKKYMDVHGMILATFESGKEDATPEFLDIDDQQIVCIQVPPMSVASFQRLTINEGVRKQRSGRTEDNLNILITQKKVVGKNDPYAQLDFSVYKGEIPA